MKTPYWVVRFVLTIHVKDKIVMERTACNKYWLIQKVSGINEQDCSVRKDEDGQD